MPADPAVLRIRTDAIAAALFLARIVRENKGCQRILLLSEQQVEVPSSSPGTSSACT